MPTWSSLDLVFFIYDQKYLGFSCIDSVKKPDTYSFLALVSSCLNFFLADVYLAQLVLLPDYLALLYN